MTNEALLSSCARAATAKEAAFRIDYPLVAARNTRVVALDLESERVVREAAAADQWNQATFYTAAPSGHDLITPGGESVPLDGELRDSNTLVMVSATGGNVEAVATIGAACRVRGIMTAGLVMTPGVLTSEALFALRPYARILLVPAEPDDLVELLRATRA